MTDPDSRLTVPSRFCGPPDSGNGGFTAGLLAERVPHLDQEDCPAVEVTLRTPPPLDVPMAVLTGDRDVAAGATTLLIHDGTTVAEARCVPLDVEPVEAVEADVAATASASYPGLRHHPFPTCFSCGVDRGEDDGLRIFPGPVAGDRMADTWVPQPSVAESSDLLDGGVPRVGLATAWAALDCVGGWAGHLAERTMVLGRITARVDALPVVGEQHVVVGARLGEEGRKTFTASTLYDADGRVVGRATHVWVAVSD